MWTVFCVVLMWTHADRQQVASAEGRTLRCELDLEDEGRQVVVFQRAQSSFSRCLTDLRVDVNVLKKTVKKPMEWRSHHAVMSMIVYTL